MMEQTVYDLMSSRPHVPEGSRFTADTWRLYEMGYQHALLIVMKALKATEARFEIRERTRRLERNRRKGQ